MSDYDQRSTAFVAEFTSQPNAVLNPSLEVADLRAQGRGRGVLAKETIPADTELFTIPRSYVMSVEGSELFQKHVDLFGELDAGEDDVLPKPWLDLILVLLHDFFRLSESKWKAYWDVLPSTFDTLMFWSDAELDELQASAVRKHIGKEKANELFTERIIPVVRRNNKIFQAQEISDAELLQMCHRMGSLIMAYAFDLQTRADSDDEEGEDGWVEDSDENVSMGMVPFADTLNADAEFNAHVEHESEALVVRSLREIKAGEEVLNYYGPLPNCDLARRYGYTSRLHSRFDVVEISWDLLFGVIKDMFGDVSIDTEDIEDSFVLERDSGEPDDTGRHTTEAKFTEFPEELVNQVSASLARALKVDMTKPTSRDTKNLKIAFLRVINRAIEIRLREYATTMDHDRQLLDANAVSGRLRMAFDIRVGEKCVLTEARDYAGAMLEKYDDRKGKKNARKTGDAPRQTEKYGKAKQK